MIKGRPVATVKALVAAAVEKLDLAPILHGEPVSAEVLQALMSDDGVPPWHTGATIFYGENGEPILGDPVAAIAQIEAARDRDGCGVVAILYSKDGLRIGVSTVYLGIRMSVFAPLPLVWETLVMVGDTPSGMLEPVRYMTRAAAHAGHEQVVAAVRAALKESSA